MKLGAEDRKKLIAAGSFGVLAVGYLLYTLVGTGGSSSDAPPAAAPVATTSRPAIPVTSGAASRSATSTRLDPTLHPEGMLLAESLVYSGSGRNIFLAPNVALALAAASAIPKPIASARYVPPPTGAIGPAPPAPIDLRFFGTATRRDGRRQAFFLHGDDVLVASSGEVVSRRYRVGAITLTNVEVTDLTNNNTQRLPMSTQ